MKDTHNKFLHGVALLVAFLVTTGSANADFSPKKREKHTVQDAIGCLDHTLQDCLPIGLPNDDGWLWQDQPHSGPIEGHPPALSFGSWSESIEALSPFPETFDPHALADALPPPMLERAIAIPLDLSGGHSLLPAAGAQIPTPGALPVLGLGALALIGRRRRV